MLMQPIRDPDYLKEAFLNNYFFAEVLFSQYCAVKEMKYIYDKYAEVFCIHNEEWLNTVWDVISSDLFFYANNACDFNRLVRLSKQYPDKISSLELHMLSCKAPAIQIKADVLSGNDDPSFEGILRVLERKAKGGDTDCISLLGFLEHYGILINENSAMAEKRLEAAASWNHFFAVLLGSRYSKEMYHQKLRAILNSSVNTEVWEYLSTAMDIPTNTKPDKIALVLEAALCQGTLQRCKINDDIMNLMHSTVISESSKCSLIKAIREKVRIPSEIPLTVTKKSSIVLDFEKLDFPSVDCKQEVEQIRSNLSMIDLHDTSVYKPLLFVCEDEHVLNYYRDLIMDAFSSSPVSYVPLQKGETCNLSDSGENIFVTSMEKHGERNVVMIMDHCEKLDTKSSNELAKYLKADNRKHYKAGSMPSVELDLSGVLPVLFATTIPDHSIVLCCDMVVAEEPTQEEFKEILKKSLEKKKKIFKLNSLSAEPAVFEFLFDYSFDAVTDLLNKTIGCLRQTSKDVHITTEALQDIIGKFYSVKDKNGFWRDTTV